MPDTQFDSVDLIHPESVFVNRLPDMTTVRERVFRQFKNKLFQETRRNIQSADEKFEIISHDEFLSQGDTYNIYGVVSIQPIKGYSLIMIEGGLLAAIVDDMFGADKNQASKPAKTMSIMEGRISQKLVKIALASLDESLQQYFPAASTIIRTEEYAALASVSDAGEPFCVMSTVISMPTGSGKLSIAIPYRGLEPFREVLGAPAGGANYHDADIFWSKQIDTCIDHIPIQVGVEIARSSVSTRLVESLSIGDILPLSLHNKAILLVGNQPIAEVSYGEINSHYGVCFSHE
jgi:flagellar motor switch protein FliM